MKQPKTPTLQPILHRILLALFLTSASLEAQNLETLAQFDKEPLSKTVNLALGSDGNFYGTTSEGGTFGFGTVFKMTHAGTITPLVSFAGTDGAHPEAALTQGNDGDFYGTTSGGGQKGYGTVFKLTPAGVLTSLFSFDGKNGEAPRGKFVEITNGVFFGTTFRGGTGNKGTVFKITADGTLTMVLSFNGKNGAGPVAGLVRANDGLYYGTASLGGDEDYGTYFRMTPAGVLSYSYSFSSQIGSYPKGALVQSSDGNLYGTTSRSLFRLTPSGIISKRFNFQSFGTGRLPLGDLIRGQDGFLYGTCSAGGTNGHGTVFRLTSTGSFTNSISFTGTNGANPTFGLVQGTNGNFYGATPQGGTYNQGTVFSMTPARALTTFDSFSWDVLADRHNGSGPGGLIQGSDGNFYGGTGSGGYHGVGTVFKMTSSGALTKLFSQGEGSSLQKGLTNFSPEDFQRFYGLVKGSDGNFYGTTRSQTNFGTIFRMSPAGELTTIFSFEGTNGSNPSTLIVGGDGNFYGTTASGGETYMAPSTNDIGWGNPGWGTCFKITPSGEFTSLTHFTGTNGSGPGQLILGGNGNFYGTTSGGGSAFVPNENGGSGTIFQMTPAGQLTTLHIFNGVNGEYPSQLTLGNDGNFYGTTYGGGASYNPPAENYGWGTVFKMTLGGTFTRLVSFTGTDGAYPSTMFQGSDGNFYGSTDNGGPSFRRYFDGDYGYYLYDYGFGTVFKLTPTGTLTRLVSFNENESAPSSLIEGIDGDLYGTTYYGGALGGGTVFRVFVKTNPNSRPSIVTQPRTRTVYQGTTIGLSVTANGDNPLTYNWRKNGNILPGETNSVLRFVSVQPESEGDYSVVISNALGSVVSSEATLTVVPLPTQASPPPVRATPETFGNDVAPVITFTDRHTTTVGSISEEGETYYYENVTGTFSLNAKVSILGAVISPTDAFKISVGEFSFEGILNEADVFGPGKATFYLYNADNSSGDPVKSGQVGLVWTDKLLTITISDKLSFISSNYIIDGNVGAEKISDQTELQLSLGNRSLSRPVTVTGTSETKLVVRGPADAPEEFYLPIVSVSGVTDSVKPTVAVLTGPAANARLTNNFISGIAGTASDNFGVTYVAAWLRAEGQFFPLNCTYDEMQRNWSISAFELKIGANEIIVVAYDEAGNFGSTNRILNYVQLGAVKVTNLTPAGGNFSPNLDGKSLELYQTNTLVGNIGKHQMKALSASNYVFNGWTLSPTGKRVLNSTLDFLMVPGLEISAEFVTNNFKNVQGNYNGLIAKADSRTMESLGSFTAKLSALGKFTGKILINTASYKIDGQFMGDGIAITPIPVRNRSALELQLQLDFQKGQITGMLLDPSQISNEDEGVIGLVDAERAGFSKTNPAALYAGPHTFGIEVVEGISGETLPSGFGVGTVTVGADGSIKLSGKLADGTAVTQSSAVSDSGKWALHIPLYSKKGVLHGWIKFANKPNSTFQEEQLTWIRPALATSAYPTGFTVDAAMDGSLLVPIGIPLLDLSNSGTIAIDGDFGTIEAQLAFTSNKFSVLGENPQKIGLTLAPAKGAFSGAFTSPEVISATPMRGAILQKRNLGLGYFQTAVQNGPIWIAANKSATLPLSLDGKTMDLAAVVREGFFKQTATASAVSFQTDTFSSGAFQGGYNYSAGFPAGGTNDSSVAEINLVFVLANNQKVAARGMFVFTSETSGRFSVITTVGVPGKLSGEFTLRNTE